MTAKFETWTHNMQALTKSEFEKKTGAERLRAIAEKAIKGT